VFSGSNFGYAFTFFILAHQPDFDVVPGNRWEMIFRPWVERIEQAGGRVSPTDGSDLTLDNTGHGVVCGDEVFDADAVIFAVGVSGMQKIVSSPSLQSHKQFQDISNLGSVDVPTRFDANCHSSSLQCLFRVRCDDGLDIFDLQALHDEYRNQPGTVIEADFYHANQFLPLSDEEIVAIVQHDLATCIPAFGKRR